jgi:light-regulated signal transduction histidine kinase (bacteriophytochrome)
LENKDQIASLNRKLEQRNTEFKEFIYRTSHDVRGPIATIKGLANVARLENKCPELTIYFDLISKVANRLDLILEYLNETSGNEDYSYFEINKNTFFENMLNRLNKLKDLYDLNFDLMPVRKFNETIFVNNESQIFGLTENLLLVLTTENHLSNLKYAIEFGFQKTGLVVDIIYHNVKINYVSSAIEQLFSIEQPEPDKRIGYNNMRINIVNRCLKLTSTSLTIIEKNLESIIRIETPSLQFINRK